MLWRRVGDCTSDEAGDGIKVDVPLVTDGIFQVAVDWLQINSGIVGSSLLLGCGNRCALDGAAVDIGQGLGARKGCRVESLFGGHDGRLKSGVAVSSEDPVQGQ